MLIFLKWRFILCYCSICPVLNRRYVALEGSLQNKTQDTQILFSRWCIRARRTRDVGKKQRPRFHVSEGWLPCCSALCCFSILKTERLLNNNKTCQSRAFSKPGEVAQEANVQADSWAVLEISFCVASKVGLSLAWAGIFLKNENKEKRSPHSEALTLMDFLFNCQLILL